jgi:hypothetical protein
MNITVRISTGSDKERLKKYLIYWCEVEMELKRHCPVIVLNIEARD